MINLPDVLLDMIEDWFEVCIVTVKHGDEMAGVDVDQKFPLRKEGVESLIIIIMNFEEAKFI